MGSLLRAVSLKKTLPPQKLSTVNNSSEVDFFIGLTLANQDKLRVQRVPGVLLSLPLGTGMTRAYSSA